MTKVYIHPDHAETNNGIGQVINVQFRYLPTLGIQIVKNPQEADIIACHVTKAGLNRVDVLHCHGLYWTGDIGSGVYSNWHSSANRQILTAAREANFITVPSDWVGEPFRRDMHIKPIVIGHGLNLSEWEYQKNSFGKPILWNKNRAGDVCDPTPAFILAKVGYPVISTFSPNADNPRNMRVTGVVSHPEMKKIIYQSGVYLATTQETFGIGTLEAMAAGLAVLGYRHGATPDIVRDGIDGILVEPGDTEALIEAYKQITPEMGKNARQRAEQYSWEIIMRQYADLYTEAANYHPKNTVTVVITNHPNNTKFVGDAIKSVLGQTEKPDEIIVVDDNSSEDSLKIINDALAGHGKVITKVGANGAAGARNTGLSEATGDFVTCLDADDRLKPSFIRVMKKELVDKKILGIVYCDFDFIISNGEVTNFARCSEFSFEKMATPGNPPIAVIPTPSACMFRREIWKTAGGYQQMYAPAEDVEFWLRALSLGWYAKKVNENLSQYRVHPGTESRTKKYQGYDRYHPWMVSKDFPMAAPIKDIPLVRSYSRPFVSIIIPVGPYHQNDVKQAIMSVEWQSFKDWELIVVNDTGQDIDLFAYPFAKEIKTTGSMGAGYSRNVGLDVAKGSLCVFLDADDMLEPEFLDHTIHEYSNRGGKYIYTDWIDRGEVIQSNSYNQYEWENQHPVTVLMETEVARKLRFDENMPGWEDWDFFLKCAINGVIGWRLGEPLLRYNINTGKRRKIAFEKKPELLEILKQRYSKYYNGSVNMPGCCGGGNAARILLEAKKAIGERSTVKSITGGNEVPTKVRMQYIGERSGGVTYNINGHQYRGGKNPQNRYIDAEPGDVDKLEATGSFLKVQRGGTPIPSPVNTPEIEEEKPEVQQQTAPIEEPQDTELPAEVIEQIEASAQKSISRKRGKNV